MRSGPTTPPSFFLGDAVGSLLCCQLEERGSRGRCFPWMGGLCWRGAAVGWDFWGGRFSSLRVICIISLVQDVPKQVRYQSPGVCPDTQQEEPGLESIKQLQSIS